jgi:FkbM family methyltransferase
MRTAIKNASISLGLYKPARSLYRTLRPSKKRHFQQHTEFLTQFIKPEDLAFDVGANIGERTEMMLSLGAKVVAFEPQSNCIREIRAKGNGYLTVVEKAVGSSIGSADLHLKAANVQASLLDDWQGGPNIGSIRVPVTTLDEEIKIHGIPTFCKIDVEGYEAEVVAGLSSPIRALSFEYHCDERGVQKLRSIFDRMQQIGNYEANLIGGENASWLSDWMPIKRFISRFPMIAQGNFWGDCFVRETSSQHSIHAQRRNSDTHYSPKA